MVFQGHERAHGIAHTFFDDGLPELFEAFHFGSINGGVELVFINVAHNPIHFIEYAACLSQQVAVGIVFVLPLAVETHLASAEPTRGHVAILGCKCAVLILKLIAVRVHPVVAKRSPSAAFALKQQVDALLIFVIGIDASLGLSPASVADGGIQAGVEQAFGVVDIFVFRVLQPLFQGVLSDIGHEERLTVKLVVLVYGVASFYPAFGHRIVGIVDEDIPDLLPISDIVSIHRLYRGLPCLVFPHVVNFLPYKGDFIFKIGVNVLPASPIEIVRADHAVEFLIIGWFFGIEAHSGHHSQCKDYVFFHGFQF